MLGNDIKITQLVGVGDVELHFQPNQRVYCLIGENGVGKTKSLEALFAFNIYSYKDFGFINNLKKETNIFHFFNEIDSKFLNVITQKKGDDISVQASSKYTPKENSNPIVFIGTNERAYIESKVDKDDIANKKARFTRYMVTLRNWLKLENKDTNYLKLNIHEWIIQRAQSANKYQAKEDNREVEITTLLKLLNQVDGRINDSFLQISGDNSVYIQIEGKKTELSELSSGFASLLKIIQSIIAGYSYFTNETDIANVEGLVFIDEIESHLHSKWQANIINILKSIFPNTTFYITTHSAIVISQLQDGEVYEMYRDEVDKVVKTKQIQHPNKVALVDLLKNAFDVDINRIKLDLNTASSQGEAKQALLDLLDSRIDELEQLENN